MTPQELLWKGQFGSSYHERNQQKNRFEFWLNIMGKREFDSALELGAGQGDNLDALRVLRPDGRFVGIDINHDACVAMQNRGLFAIEGPVDAKWRLPPYDLVLTRGFLIHVPDEQLHYVLEFMYSQTSRYIAIAEYFSPVRREIEYRGYSAALWCDNFPKQIMDMHPDLKLVDYGFEYDNDYLTWFLLEK